MRLGINLLRGLLVLSAAVAGLWWLWEYVIWGRR